MNSTNSTDMRDTNGSNFSTLNGTTADPLCDLNYYCEPMTDYFDRLGDYIYPEPREWPLIVTYIITFLVGLIGNTLVCFAIWRNRKMRTITNIFIVNLSAADLAVILVCLPSTLLIDVTETWFLGTVFCKIHIYLTTVAVSVSVLTLSSISVERWYAICRPLTFHSTVRRARVIIIIIWSVSFCVALPEFIFSTVTPFRNDTVILSACYPSLLDSDKIVAFQICLMVALYVLPLALMGLTYTHIAVVLWTKTIPGAMERGRNVLREPSGQAESEEHKIESRRKAAKMLIAVVVMFGLCFFPNHLLNILRYTNQLSKLPQQNVFALFAHWATFLSSCINPVIYNFMSDKFRKEFKVAVSLCIRCGRKQNNRSYSERYKTTCNSVRTYSARYTSHYNGSTCIATCMEHVPLTLVHKNNMT